MAPRSRAILLRQRRPNKLTGLILCIIFLPTQPAYADTLYTTSNIINNNSPSPASNNERVVTLRQSRAFPWHGVGTPPPPPFGAAPPAPPATPPWVFVPGGGVAPSLTPLWPHVLQALQLSRNLEARRSPTPSSGRFGNYRRRVYNQHTAANRRHSGDKIHDKSHSVTNHLSTAADYTAIGKQQLTNTNPQQSTSPLPAATTAAVSVTNSSSSNSSSLDQNTAANNAIRVGPTTATLTTTGQWVTQHRPQTDPARSHRFQTWTPTATPVGPRQQGYSDLIARQGRFTAYNDRASHMRPDRTVQTHRSAHDRTRPANKKKTRMGSFIDRILRGLPKTAKRKSKYRTKNLLPKKYKGHKHKYHRPKHSPRIPDIARQIYARPPESDKSAYTKIITTDNLKLFSENSHPPNGKTGENHKLEISQPKLGQENKHDKQKVSIEHVADHQTTTAPLVFNLEDAANWESRRIRLDDIVTTYRTQAIDKKTMRTGDREKFVPAYAGIRTKGVTPHTNSHHHHQETQLQQPSHGPQEIFTSRAQSESDQNHSTERQRTERRSDGTLVVTGQLVHSDPHARSPMESRADGVYRSDRNTHQKEPVVVVVATEPAATETGPDTGLQRQWWRQQQQQQQQKLSKRHLGIEWPAEYSTQWQPAHHLAVTLHQLLARSRQTPPHKK